jgi:hypothetical protein
VPACAGDEEKKDEGEPPASAIGTTTATAFAATIRGLLGSMGTTEERTYDV